MADAAPEDIVRKAIELQDRGNIGIAYTYNEPSIWYEFVYDTSRLLKKHGLSNVMVTNGFISREPLKNILPYIDAMNIDVKAFTGSFYKEVCKGALDDVKETVELSAKSCHVEVTTLIIPGMNDSEKEIEELAQWLAGISPDIPLHLSRFFPNYKMSDRMPTPVPTLEKLQRKALSHLRQVYLGNV
jgi:pyruvate formate lyase activating enzyme